MKILLVRDNSIGVHYVRLALNYVDPKKAEVTSIKLSWYPDFDDSGFDGLIYNTFPDENHPGKFRKALIDITDKKLKAFKGKVLLFDSHDEGYKNAFLRFGDSREQPRIKNVPCYNSTMNSIIPVTFSIFGQFMDASQPKTIPLLYCAGLEGYPHDTRKQVFNILKPFKPFTKRLGLMDYIQAMKNTRISVVAPGYGTACIAHLESLAAGAMLLAHESIRNTKLLPFFDLEENIHYVLYNLENLAAKIAVLLKNPHHVARIATAGHEAFMQGYDPDRTAGQIINYFKQEEVQYDA